MDLQERLAEVETELRQIHEAAGDAALDEEQQPRFDELVVERDQLNKKIADEKRRTETVRNLASKPGHIENGDGATGAPPAPEVMRRVDPFDGEVRGFTGMEARDKALKVLEDRDSVAHLEQRQLDHLDRTLRHRSRNTDGSAIARRLLLTESPHYRSAFMKVTTMPNAPLTPEEGRAIEAFNEFRAMSVGTDSAGGFGVPVIIDPTIILTGQGHPNPFLAISRVEVITNDEWRGVSSAGVTWSFDAEASEVSDDSPTLDQPTVPTHKAQGFIPYSIEVGMDYPGFANEMSMLLSEGYSELLVEKFTTGSGAGEPTGIEDALDANTNVEVSVDTDGALFAADVYDLWEELPIRYRPNASWLSSTSVQNEIRQFASGSDNSDANFTVNITQEAVPQLFGRRYYVSDYLPNFTGSTNAVNLLIVGDFSNFLIAQRAGMSVELVPHLFDTANNRPSGQRGWYAWARVGSDSVNDLGFRILQNT